MPAPTQAQWLRHEGHPGWTFPQIDNILNLSFASAAKAPDLITIHLGTNDCGHETHAGVDAIEKNAHSLLAHIFAKAPKALGA